jgi:O-antigen/teichoic acid export membrane protein
MLYSLAAFFGVFIAFQSENLLMIFTDERFSGALAALIIMAFYPLHQTYGQINSALFFAMEKVDVYKNIGVLSTLLGLPLSFLFIYFLEWGAEGFAWKMVLLQLVAVNVQLYFNVKFLNLKFLSYIKHQLFALMFFVLIAVCSVSISPEFSSDLLNVLFSGFLYALLVMVGVYLLPSVFSTSRNELNIFGTRIKNKFKLSKSA